MILRTAFAFKNQIFGTGLAHLIIAGVVIGFLASLLFAYQPIEYFQDSFFVLGCFLDCDPVLLCAFIPIIIYSNVSADKAQILSENKNKSGIYMFKNTINGKRYIGSSENLNRRLSEYFNINYLIRDNSMQICRVLKKHGYSNFSLTIIEYCDKKKNV
jgi:predicted GIY-YIG superfamily endonuclease